MNYSALYALSPEQKAVYVDQPDQLAPPWEEYQDEFQPIDFVAKTRLRLWYNVQTDSYATHWHNSWEIIVPLENGYHVTTENDTFDLVPGDIFVIPGGELHALTAPEWGARFIFTFEIDPANVLGDFSLTRSFFSHPIIINPTTCPAIYEKAISLIMDMAQVYWGFSSAKQLRIWSDLMEFYAVYTDYCCDRLPAREIGSTANATTQVRQILSYLQSHYKEPISLEEAAEKIHLSKFYFTRVFKQVTGQTFNTYLHALRIEAAQALLKDNKAPINEIAKIVGYDSLSSFNRIFRSQKGCTPSEYRKYHIHRKF